jgi:hypothetical protein
MAVKLTMLLCDHVAVAEGKFYINGGGWATTGPNPSPSGIAVLIEVPWHLTNQKIDFRLQLLHEDGQPVTQTDPAGGSAPIEIGAQLEVGRPAGVPEGTALPIPMPIGLPPLPLPPGEGFYWEAEINGERREDWRLSFRTGEKPRPSSDPTALPRF